MDGVRKDDLMAKRKAGRAGATKAGGGRKAAGRKGASARKTASRASSGRAAKATKKTARKAARPAPRRSSGPAARKAARKTAKRAAPKAAARKATARKAPTRKAARKQAAAPRRSAAPAAKKRAVGKAAVTVPVRKAPALNRERRVIQDDDIVQSTPPSSLDLDRTASSARSGRRTLSNRYAEHTETSPALTGGDVDADWESASTVGDEAPGGDNPTPDQDIVDDIGRALGVEYQDNEELKGADKLTERDKNRWELDPASSDDWDDR